MLKNVSILTERGTGNPECPSDPHRDPLFSSSPRFSDRHSD